MAGLPDPHKIGALATLFLVLSAYLAPPVSQAESPSLKDVMEQRSEEEEIKQGSPGEDAAIPARVDPLKRETPRRAVAAFLGSARNGDWNRAAKYFDFSQSRGVDPETDGPALARKFKLALDRKLWVDLDRLSNDPEGYSKQYDGLLTDRELVARIKGEESIYEISLQRGRSDSGADIWRFSSKTAAEIPAFYEEFGYGLFGHNLPQFLYETDVFGYELRIWLALLIIPALCFLVAAITTRVVQFFLNKRHTALTSQLSRFGAGPLRLLIAILLFSSIRRRAEMPIGLGTVVEAIETLFLVFTVTWMAMRLADVLWRLVNGRLIARGQRTAMGIVPPARTTTRIFLVFIAVMVILNSFGANVTAVLAGLGVGGIAVALAAQKSFENLIGGVTVFADRPVLVGDFCRIGPVLGTVESIGLRSTRVRTLDRTLVTIPNGQVCDLHIDNYAQRDQFWYHPTLGLRYETTPDQLRYVLIEIRKMLFAHPMVDPDPARIRFAGFGAYSLDLEVFAYINVRAYGSYLEVAEDLNLRIMDIVERAGSGFAFPSQTTYIEQGSGLDVDRAKQATSEVEKWRAENALFLPEFPSEQIQKLRNTLDYPPEGSPNAEARQSTVRDAEAPSDDR
jgi:MscS family membrane protein